MSWPAGLFSLITGLNHWFLGPVFSHGRAQSVPRQSIPSQSVSRQSVSRQKALRQRVPCQRVPRQKVPRQSVTHVKVSLTAHMTKWHLCQCVIMANWFHVKVVTMSKCSRQSVPRQSILRQSV